MKTGITKSDASLMSKAQHLFFHKDRKSAFFEDTVADTPIQPFFSGVQAGQQPNIQNKSTTDPPDYAYEHEAESMANQVVSGLHQPSSLPALQTKCAACEQEEKH